MSATQGSFDNAAGGSPWTRGGSGSRWTPIELIAMVLGFMVFWPIGLAILGFKYWQRKTGGADLATVATGAFHTARSAVGGFQAAAPRNWTQNNWAQQTWAQKGWARGFTPTTGNAAFDEWKGAELARLEAERLRLDNAHREFSDWLDGVRKAKDREEFDRFMNERRAKGA